jgi:hypothetical protein
MKPNNKGRVPRTIKIIVEGKAACRLHIMTIPKNRFWKACPMAPDKEVIPTIQHEFFLHNFRDFYETDVLLSVEIS